MNLPILIEVENGNIVNALFIVRISPVSTKQCMLHLAGTRRENISGEWNAGGSGRLNHTSYDETLYAGCSAQDFMAKVNNAMALINMMEKTLVARD